MFKKKLLMALLSGSIVLINPLSYITVYADEPVINSDMQIGETESESQEDPEMLDDELQTDLWVDETLTEQEAGETGEMDVSEDPSSDFDNQQEPESEPLMGKDDGNEDAAVHSVPYGTVEILTENEQLTSKDHSQTYTFTYSEEDMEAREEYLKEACLKLLFEKNFSPETFLTGIWEGYDGDLTVDLFDESDALLGTFATAQNSSTGISDYGSISSIVVRSDRYAYRITGLSVSGEADADSISDPMEFHAEYSSQDGGDIYAVSEVQTPTTYIDMALPDMDASVSELYYGESGEVTVGSYLESTYAESLKSVTMQIIFPETLTVTSLSLPVFEGRQVTLVIDGEEWETEEGATVEVNRTVSTISLGVQGNGEMLEQLQDLVIRFSNASEDATSSTITGSLALLFTDDTETLLRFGSRNVGLKGVYVAPSTDPVTPPEENPEQDTDEGSDTGDSEETEEPTESEDEDGPKEEEEPEDEGDKSGQSLIVNVIDRSGIDILHANPVIKEESHSIFILENRTDKKEEQDIPAVIDSEPVDDVSDSYSEIVQEKEEKIARDSLKDGKEASDPVQAREQSLGEKAEKAENRMKVPAFLMAAAIVAVGFLLLFIGRRKKKTDEDNDDADINEKGKENK